MHLFYNSLDYLLPSDKVVDIFMFSVGGDTMMIAPWMVVLLVLTLHLQSHHTKYFLVNVDTGDKPGRVSGSSNKALDAAPDNTTGLTIIFTY